MNIKRFKASEVTAIKIGDTHWFHLAEGVLRQPGSDGHKALRKRKSTPKTSSGDAENEEEADQDEENPYPGENIEKGCVSSEEEEEDSETPESDAPAEESDTTSESDFWSINDDCVILEHSKGQDQTLCS